MGGAAAEKEAEVEKAARWEDSMDWRERRRQRRQMDDAMVECCQGVLMHRVSHASFHSRGSLPSPQLKLWPLAAGGCGVAHHPSSLARTHITVRHIMDDNPQHEDASTTPIPAPPDQTMNDVALPEPASTTSLPAAPDDAPPPQWATSPASDPPHAGEQIAPPTNEAENADEPTRTKEERAQMKRERKIRQREKKRTSRALKQQFRSLEQENSAPTTGVPGKLSRRAKLRLRDARRAEEAAAET